MPQKCYCGNWAVERTARTDANAGQRFLGCGLGSRGCGFFRWVDGCTRCRCLQMDLEKMKLESRRWKLGFILAFLLLLYFILIIPSLEKVNEETMWSYLRFVLVSVKVSYLNVSVNGQCRNENKQCDLKCCNDSVVCKVCMLSINAIVCTIIVCNLKWKKRVTQN